MRSTAPVGDEWRSLLRGAPEHDVADADLDAWRYYSLRRADQQVGEAIAIDIRNAAHCSARVIESSRAIQNEPDASVAAGVRQQSAEFDACGKRGRAPVNQEAL